MTNFGALPANAPVPRAGLANDLASGTRTVSVGPWTAAVSSIGYVPNVFADLVVSSSFFTGGTTAVFAHLVQMSAFSQSATLAGFTLYSRVLNVTDGVLVRHLVAGFGQTVQAMTHVKAFGMAFQTLDTSYVGKTVRFELGFYSDAQWLGDAQDWGSTTFAQVAAS